MKRGSMACSVLLMLTTACGDDGTVTAGESTSTGAQTTASSGSSGPGADDSTTGAPQGCVPAAGGGAGLAYAGEPEPGVWCVDEVCEFGCDQRMTAFCNPDAEVDDYGADAYCDGPEDCAQAEVCCTREEGDAFNRTVSTCVAAACPEGERPACNVDADCDGGYCIRAYTNGGKLDLGACQAEPPSPCMPAPDTDCSGASLRHMDLDGTDLRDANLCQADLFAATLRGALLDRAVLADVDLGHAYLNGASLRDADLSGADLRHAVFHDADLTGADLTGALLEGTLGGDVICPDGTLSDILDRSLCEGKLDP